MNNRSYWSTILQKVNIDDVEIVYTEESACQDIRWTDDDNNNMLLEVTLTKNNSIRTERLYKITESGEKIREQSIDISSRSFIVSVTADESETGSSESLEKIKSHFSDPAVELKYSFLIKIDKLSKTYYSLEFKICDESMSKEERTRKMFVLFPQIVNMLELNNIWYEYNGVVQFC